MISRRGFLLSSLSLAACGGSEETESKPILVVGDSHAELWANHPPNFVVDGKSGDATWKAYPRLMKHNMRDFRKVFLMLGTNDCALGGATALPAMISYILSGSIPVLFQIPEVLIPHDGWAMQPTTWNTYVRSFGLQMIDGYSVSLKAGTMLDGIHFNAMGYEEINKQARTL